MAISLRKYGCLLPNKGHWGERAAHGQDQIPGQIQNATPIGAMKAPRHCAVISGFYSIGGYVIKGYDSYHP